MTFPSRKHTDRPFWVLYLILVFAAILAAGCTFSFADKSPWGAVRKQTVLLIAGVGVAYFMQYLPTKAIRALGWVILVFSVICLWVILIPGNPFAVTINGAKRWINLGITFQPSELAKLGLAIAVSDLLTRPEYDKRDNEEKAKTPFKTFFHSNFFYSLLLTLITCLPIMVGNLSTAVLLAFIVLLMWILSRQKAAYILSVVSISAILLVSGFLVIKTVYVDRHKPVPLMPRASVWVKRAEAVITEQQTKDEEFRLTDENYQRSIAKVAVMRGGKTPLGVFLGNSQERDFLPLAYADYIFAIIVEETGIVGAALLILIYLAILFRACYASSRYADYSAMLMMMGLALTITCQALISMAVAVGIGPVTGQPLPLISRGGTSVIFTSMFFGMMMAVAREQNMLKARQEQSKIDIYNETPEIELV